MIDFASTPPPTEIIYAQAFHDPGDTFNLMTTTTPTSTTANAQKPVDTLSIPNYLASKFIGINSVITNSERQSLGQGVVTRIEKSENGYTCQMYDPRSRTEVVALIVFEGFIHNAPTEKRWAMSVSTQVQNKRLLEAESQLSTMISGIGAESITAAVNPGERLPEPSPDLLPAGENLPVIDIKSGQFSTQPVVIYKGRPFLSNGVPLNVRLEYQP
jgi:hypothetical protein